MCMPLSGILLCLQLMSSRAFLAFWAWMGMQNVSSYTLVLCVSVIEQGSDVASGKQTVEDGSEL